MRRTVVLTLAYGMGVLAFAAPIVVSLLLADRQSRIALEERAYGLASEVLNDNLTISDQIVKAVRTMEEARAAEPCSQANLRLMQQVALSSSRLHVVGYIANNRLLCSSLGRHGTGLDVGPPDFLSIFGYHVRRDVRLPLSSSQFRVSASAKSGYAAFAHVELASTIVLDDPDLAVGLVGIASQRLLFQRGLWRPQWLERLGKSAQAIWVDEDHIVAMKRSTAYNYAAYAAIPLKVIEQEGRRHLLWMLPVGAIAGLILVLCIYLAVIQQFSLPAQLRHGLKTGELFLVYQPIVDLDSGRWVGAEALLRWQLRDGTLVSPDIFIPTAERRGMAGMVTAYVLRTFASEAAALLRAHPDFFISLNFAPADLEDPASVERLASLVSTMGIRPRNVHVEATERVFMNAAKVKHNLRDLRTLGFRMAIDDFGTGYSSLSYLTSLEVDYLKIDKSFVSSIGTGSATSQVVSHIIDMARALQLSMVAEGVETQAQADYLREHRVQHGQGWLFARPMPMSALSAQLAAQSTAPPPA